jgi:hypothetical protein
MIKQNSEDTRGMLFTLWLMFNAVGTLFVWAAWDAGWVSEILKADSFYICRAVVGFFALSLFTCTWKTVKMVRELEIARKYVHLLRSEKNSEAYLLIEKGNSRVANYIAKVRGLAPQDRYSIENNLRISMQHKISGTGIDLSNLVSLGIIGTVIGMKLFASDFAAKSAGVDPKIFDIVRASLPGLDLALSATLLGGIGAFWLGYLFRILISAKEQLVSTLIEAGVYRGQS